MKILINGFYNFLPKGEETFSGPRNFLQNFLDYIGTTEHTYTALVLRGKKKKDARYETERVEVGKSSWLVATLRLNTPDVFNATSSRVPASLEQPLKIITKIMAEEKPDVVFLKGMSITNWFLLKAAKRLGIPVISNHLGLWYKEIVSYNNSTPGGIKMMMNMEKDLSRLGDKEIFLTKLSFRHYSRQLIKPTPSKVEIIPLSYDPIYLNKTLPGFKKRKVLKIGVVGRWDPIKNLRAILTLAKEIKSQGLDWQIYSVTTIHKQYPWDRDIVEEYPKFVTVMPPMSPAELKKFYKDMDLMLLPSVFDVSPSVVMEALLQNRATLISATVGWVDAYRETGSANLIIDFKNPKKVTERIKTLIGKPPRRALISRIMAQHKPEVVFRRYLALAQSLISRK